MTGGQRTFELIPTSLVKSNGQRRPMTSKAAKKAYQLANRGPKFSRAEQHRRDNAELEAQKKEYEKEQAAARAKVAREKKAAKADADREARRKQGLPEPSRFVHASQPSISRFVRSNSTSKRTWQQMESVVEDSDKTISKQKGDGRPPAKRQAVDEGSDDEFGEFPTLSQSDLLEQIDSSILSVQDAVSSSGSPAKGYCLSQDRPCGILQDLPLLKETDKGIIFNSQAPNEMITTQLLSDLVEAVTKSDSIEPPDMDSSQRPKETNEAVPKSQPSQRRSGRLAQKVEKETGKLNPERPSTIPVVDIPAKPVKAVQPLNLTVKNPNNKEFKAQALKAALQRQSVNMPPPRIPSKVSMAMKSISTPERPSFPSRNYSNIVPNPLPNLPPSSTQAFLENHLDDFFPSPTQAERELLDDMDGLPPRISVTRELSPKKAEKDTRNDLFGKQDLILSQEDLAEITTPHCTLPRPLNEATSESLDRNIQEDTHRALESKESKNDLEDFLGTQDLILSPEDLEEICSPTRPLPQTLPEGSTGSPNQQVHAQPRPTTQGKRRFFQEKEEDLYHAAIQESRAASAQGTSKAHADTSASLGRDQCHSTDYGEFDFDLPSLFSEKEEEDFEAAIRASKITAELEAKRLALAGIIGTNPIRSDSTDYGDFESHGLSEEQEYENQSPAAVANTHVPKHPQDVTAKNGKDKPRRFFEEKYEDQVHAAIHESKMLAANQVPLGEGKEKPKRTLKRVGSTATDYGDDDFTGCSQELLKLCNGSLE